MSRPKFVQARRTTLSIGISAAEASEIKLKSLKDIYGEALAMSDFGDELYLTIAPGTENEEIIKATDFTVNSDGSVLIDTGIVRGLSPVSAYGTTSLASPHAAGTIVVASNNPQFYEAILAYMEGIVNAGAADASETSAGIVEEGTIAEIDADTGAGATSRRLFVNPSKLASSKYGTRLPSANGKQMLDAVTGMIFDYAGNSAPTGFLMCDGSAISNNTYASLLAIVKGYYGVGTATTFTADNTTDFLTAVSHGLSNGDILLIANSGGGLPSGLTANTLYYVVNKTTNTFQLALTAGGAAVNFTTNGTGTQSYYTTFKLPYLNGTMTIGSGQKIKTFTFLDAGVNTGTDVITVESNSYLYTGQSAVLSTSGVLPTGLSATTYYIIRTSATTIKLATSVLNANNGTAVDITAAAGGGTHTLTVTMTSRTHADEGGTEYTAEVPSHNHTQANYTTGSANGGGGGVATGSGVVSTTGGSTPNNMPPFVVVSKIIKT